MSKIVFAFLNTKIALNLLKITKTMKNEISISEKKVKSKESDQISKLLKKLSSLEKEANLQREQLEKLLTAFVKDILPIMEKRKQMVDEWIQQLMCYYDTSQLKANDKPLLTEIIAYQLKEYTYLSDGNLPEHLALVFERIEGLTFEEAKGKNFIESVEAITEKLTEMGLDLDLSGLKQDSTEEELRKYFAEILENKIDQNNEFNTGQRKKTKKQEEKERKEKLAEELKNKSINSVYRELAKAIHPDLEQDAELRKIKEEVMKELTAAYEKQDLRTLFRLEMEWLQKEESELDTKPDELLKIYKKMLKDQIEDLQMEIEMEDSHARFARIKIHFHPEIQLRKVNIKEFIEREEYMLKEYVWNVREMKKHHPPVVPKLLREFISEFRHIKNSQFNW